MRFFYLIGNICSILGFVGLILQSLGTFKDSLIAKWLIISFIILTGVFWAFFYFKPINKISKIINSRLDFTGSYLDSDAEQHDIYEGEFDLSNWYIQVPLPPFEKPPKIRVLSNNKKEDFPLPEIGDITEDSFIAKANASSAFGKWKFRARGKRLTKILNQ